MTCVPIQNGFLCVAPPDQPATKIRRTLMLSDEGDKGIKVRRWVERHPGNQLMWCYKCRKRRPAKNLRVVAQEWYEDLIFCADGKGCAP